MKKLFITLAMVAISLTATGQTMYFVSHRQSITVGDNEVEYTEKVDIAIGSESARFERPNVNLNILFTGKHEKMAEHEIFSGIQAPIVDSDGDSGYLALIKRSTDDQWFVRLYYPKNDMILLYEVKER